MKRRARARVRARPARNFFWKNRRIGSSLTMIDRKKRNFRLLIKRGEIVVNTQREPPQREFCCAPHEKSCPICSRKKVSSGLFNSVHRISHFAFFYISFFFFFIAEDYYGYSNYFKKFITTKDLCCKKWNQSDELFYSAELNIN